MKCNQDELSYWVDTILVKGKNVTKWERDFVESIQNQLDRTGSLSERQIEILERIYAERTN